MKLGVRYGVGVMAIGTVIFWVFSTQLMSIFSPSDEMMAMGVRALHVMSLSFPVAGFCIMRGSTFQALGKSVYSMNISLVRQLGVIIPVASFGFTGLARMLSGATRVQHPLAHQLENQER